LSEKTFTYEKKVMNKRRLILLLLSLVFTTKGICQKPDSSSLHINLPDKLPAIIVNGDTMALVNLNEVVVVGDRVFKSYDDAMRYYMLKRDVKIVYPYAILAQATFDQCQETLKTMASESDKKHYVKTVEKQLMKQYSDELKGLTMRQGKLLIKLIDRETGNTSYDMVKELKGSFTAFLWQTVACIFGNNLKSTYDAEGEDKDIESIIGLIEVGAI
jgi:hypothetical protein